MPNPGGCENQVGVPRARHLERGKRLFGRRRITQIQRDASGMHDAVISVVRQPGFFVEHGVPDTFQGRFDVLVMVAAVLLRRLRVLGAEGVELAQEFVDEMFRRLDVAMRELGVSDIGVPKRMKRLAEAFKGCSAAYDAALGSNDLEALAAAVSRNVLDGKGDGRSLALYIKEADARVGIAGLHTLRSGDLPYPQLSELKAA